MHAYASDNVSLHQIASDLFEQAWQDIVQKDHEQFSRLDGQCRFSRLLPEAIRLITACPHRNAEQLKPAIRQLVMESEFVDEPGDIIFEHQYFKEIDAFITACTRVFEELRPRLFHGGQWAHMPVTPQMYG